MGGRPTRVTGFSTLGDRERGRGWQERYLGTLCSSLISWLGWQTIPVCPGLRNHPGYEIFSATSGKSQANWGRLVSLFLAGLRRMVRTDPGMERDVSDSLRGMWYLERLLMKLADPWLSWPGKAVSSAGWAQFSEETFWPWRKLSSLQVTPFRLCIYPSANLCSLPWASVSKMTRSAIWKQGQSAIQWLNFSLRLLLNIELINVAEVHLL